MEQPCNFTSPEQSELLLKVGLPANSADCYHNDIFCTGNYTKVEFRQTSRELSDNFFKNEPKGKVFPCWTSGQLMKIFRIASYRGVVDWIEHGAHSFIDCCVNRIEAAALRKELDFSILEEQL